MQDINAGLDLAEVRRQIESSSSQGAAPLDKWNPEYCGDIDLVITKEGRWIYNGSPLGRAAMIKLFSTVLWLENGQYFLKTPVEKVGIQVEDVPFFLIHMDVTAEEGQQRLTFCSSTEDIVVADSEHPISVEIDAITGEPSPYIMMRYGMKGRISRSVFYELVSLAEIEIIEGVESLVVSSKGVRFNLGSA